MIRNFILEYSYPVEYKTWKRKNVTIRGVAKMGQENDAGAMLGNGLYTAFLSNRELAKQYGTVYFVVNAIPKKPLIFNTLNDWEIWIQRNLYPKDKGYPSLRDFFAQGKTYEDEIQKLGYDGVIVKGREMVNYNPPDDVMYFQNDDQLLDYYYNSIKK